MQKSNYEIQILINGHPAKEYYKDNKHYIEGRKGVEYQIKIKNNGSKRILAIPTVDGLSVMNGQVANYESPGYIVDGYSSTTIKGWRTSDKEVASFYFSEPKDSYAEKTDKGNIGVIGCAIFREKEYQIPNPIYIYEQLPPYCWFCCRYHRGQCFHPPITLTYYNTNSNSSTMLCTTASLQSTPTNYFLGMSENLGVKTQNDNPMQSLGTGFGEIKQDSVTKIRFEEEKNPDAVFEILYNTRKNLEKLGIDFNETPKYVAPRAFPGEYCEPPK